MISALALALTLAAPKPTMRVHCIDVRQASAELFEFPCGAILIDGGADSAAHSATVANYLDKFFDKRPDLHRTLKAVFLTHYHVDHTKGLPEVFARFTVESLITGGPPSTNASGMNDMNRVYAQLQTRPVAIREVYDREVQDDLPRGVTDSVIDPLQCDRCDPKITVLSGRLMADPGIGAAWKDENNNSLVIRIDFMRSSVLVTGDLQDPAIHRLVQEYRGSGMLDTDLYIAGHHGARNGTTQELLDAVTPKLAFVSCGHHDDGETPPKPFTTWAYGHPSKDTLDLLQTAIAGRRSKPLKVWVGVGGKKFEDGYSLRKAVYGTAWDGDLRFSTDGTGTFRKLP